MTQKQKLIQLLNNELNTNLKKLEIENSNKEFNRIENNGKTPNVYFKKIDDSFIVQLIATTTDEKENVLDLFSLIHSLFEKTNKDDLKALISDNLNYEKIFEIDKTIIVSLKRDDNTFTLQY